VAWSDDFGATWIPQLAMDIGVGHDSSTPFATFILDDQGNPYFAFNSQDPTNATSAATCAAESSGATPNTDPACSYNTYVLWSSDGGFHWDGGGGTVPGSAATAYRASPTSQHGTSQFTAIAAGDPGKVAVTYFHTDSIEPTDAAGKFLPLGCDGGDNSTNTTPANYPPRCHWYLVSAQSLDLTQPPGSETWTNNQLQSTAVHYGDICNLGIACAQAVTVNHNGVPRDPRHELDFTSGVVDPSTGCAHFSYADDNAGSTYGDPSAPSPNGLHLMSANQIDGPAIIGAGTCGTVVGTPEAPWAILLIPAGVAVAAFYGSRQRRRVARRS